MATLVVNEVVVLNAEEKGMVWLAYLTFQRYMQGVDRGPYTVEVRKVGGRVEGSDIAAVVKKLDVAKNTELHLIGGYG